jgi:ATP-binding cassette subfamily B protein RaxB
LIDKGVDLRMMRLHVERLADVLISPPEIIYSQSEFTPRSSRIDVNVSFRYAEGEPWILKDCSFSVQEGESVAIVGPSGCGKTTLIKVLLGLLTPEHGSVSIDGQSIASIGISNYRSVLGAVMQEDQLFSGTIAENIAFFDDSIDQDKVEAAADIAAIHREIIAMPMGYQSLIGDMGSTLSGGQKQRIILARALYRDPKILFLDEATSHLDVKNEKLINDSIRNLKITKIIVAHRPETILSADRILTLRDGSVVRPEDLNLAGLGNTPTTRHT